MAGAAGALPEQLGGRPVLAPDLHLTLCFIGEVPVAALTRLPDAVAGIKAIRLRLQLTMLDCWLRSRVLCLLPQGGPELDAVADLAADLASATRAADLTVDPKPFRAHVTLARKLALREASARTWPQALPVPLPFTADGFVLMQGTGMAAGPRYETVHTWPAEAGQCT